MPSKRRSDRRPVHRRRFWAQEWRPQRMSGSQSTREHRRSHCRRLHSTIGRRKESRGDRVGGSLHGRCGIGGSTVGTRRGEMLSASAITGIDSFSGPCRHTRSRIGPHSSKSWGSTWTRKNDDINASQEGRGAAGAVGGLARGEEHGDSSGGSRIDREATPRGVCDQTGEEFRAVASAAEQAASEWAGEKGGGVAKG